jgi:hypothetical protein
MPLENAKPGTPGFGRNIGTEIRAGKDPKQAEAIAYSKARGDESPAFDKLFAAADALYAKADAVRKDADCEADANERPVAHLRHKGVMIDTSFKKGSNGTEVDYYVVEGSSGRFYTLAAAKEVAEGIAERKSRKDSSSAWKIRRDGDEWEALGTSGGKPKAYRLPVKEFATEADAMAWVEQNEESLRADAEMLSVKEAKKLGKEYAERGNSRQRLQEVLRAEGADGAAMRAGLESFDKV